VREPRPIPGAKTPLFDRLLDDGIDVRQPVTPSRALDLPKLRNSVRQDLTRLLNTRSNLRGDAQKLAEGTVIDYGIPDIGPISPANEMQRNALAQRIEKVIAIYEPRLRDAKVLIQVDKANPTCLIGVVHATLAVGSILEPVYFPLTLDGTGKNIGVSET
jgi:type VI secretion system protein ImpF